MLSPFIFPHYRKSRFEEFFHVIRYDDHCSSWQRFAKYSVQGYERFVKISWLWQVHNGYIFQDKKKNPRILLVNKVLWVKKTWWEKNRSSSYLALASSKLLHTESSFEICSRILEVVEISFSCSCKMPVSVSDNTAPAFLISSAEQATT